MKQIRRTLGIDSFFITLLLRRSRKKCFWFLVLLSVAGWSVIINHPLFLTADQEQGVPSEQKPPGAAKPGEQSHAPIPSEVADSEVTDTWEGDLALVQS